MGKFRFGKDLVLNYNTDNCSGCCKPTITETTQLNSGDVAYLEYETGNYGSDFKTKSPGPDYTVNWYALTGECKWIKLGHWKADGKYYCLEYAYSSQLPDGKYKVEAVNPNGNTDFTTEFTIGKYNESFCCKIKKAFPFLKPLPCPPGTSSTHSINIKNIPYPNGMSL